MVNVGGERYCHICGQRITGQYSQYTTGLVVCARCQSAAPRCARCKIPVQARAASRSPRGVLLCSSCAKAVDHCASCNEPILDLWYRFEELLPAPGPRHFCAACVRDRPRCDLCRAPAGPRAVTLSDGQYRCGLCASDLVIGEVTIRRTYSDALEGAASLLGGRLRLIPPLEVVNRRRMGEIRRAYAHGLSQTGNLLPAAPAFSDPTPTQVTKPGVASSGARHLLGFYVRAQGKPVIYVEAGLTRGLLLGTLAHELGHAWQAEQLGSVAATLDPLFSEGFAEWVAYTVLRARGFPALATRARERQDDYGRGLNRFLEYERVRGRQATLVSARAGRF